MSVAEQSRTFCLFFIIGLFIRFIFDLFRGFRKNFKISDILVDLQDIFFLVISGYLFFRSVVLFNNGNIRFYIVIATVMRNCNLLFDIIRKLCYNNWCNFETIKISNKNYI